MGKLRILCAEDSPDDLLFVQRMMADTATVDVAINKDALLELVKENWDLILVDWKLGSMDGAEAVRIIRKHHADVPLILLSGSIDDESAAAILRLGFVDYLRKDRLHRLPHAIENAHRNHLLQRQALRDNRLEILGHMTTGLLHDLNQILQVFLSGPEILRRIIEQRLTFMPDDIGRVIDAMESTGRRGTEMSKQIAAFVRGGNGSSMKTIAPEFLLTELRLMLRESFPKNITVTTHTVPGTAKVHCDPVQMGQVLLNLAVNAKDAMTPNGGELEVTAQNVSLEAGMRVQIQVHDTGPGIPDEVKPKIFDAFFTTKATGHGTGLGLSMARKIVHDHNGEISVKTGSRGTSFFLYLPAAHAETHAESVTRSQEENYDGKGRLILIVDDEAHMRSLIEMFLRDANYKTLTAANGMEAMSFFRSNHNIALLLSDVNMPHFSGENLASALRAQKYELPIIFLTGQADATPETFNPSPTGVLLKPFGRRTLLSKLRDCLDSAAVLSAP